MQGFYFLSVWSLEPFRHVGNPIVVLTKWTRPDLAEHDGFEPSHDLRRDLCLANRRFTVSANAPKAVSKEIESSLPVRQTGALPLRHETKSVIERSRTAYLLCFKQALYQLSYNHKENIRLVRFGLLLRFMKTSPYQFDQLVCQLAFLWSRPDFFKSQHNVIKSMFCVRSVLFHVFRQLWLTLLDTLCFHIPNLTRYPKACQGYFTNWCR